MSTNIRTYIRTYTLYNVILEDPQFFYPLLQDLVRALSQEPLHRVNSSTSGGRVLELEKELAAQKIEAEEAADELERKRLELQESETREEQLKQQLDSANVKIATLEEHVSAVLQMAQSLVSVQILCVHTLIHLLHLSVGMYTCLYIRTYIDVYVSVHAQQLQTCTLLYAHTTCVHCIWYVSRLIHRCGHTCGVFETLHFLSLIYSILFLLKSLTYIFVVPNE